MANSCEHGNEPSSSIKGPAEYQLVKDPASCNHLMRYLVKTVNPICTPFIAQLNGMNFKSLFKLFTGSKH
jgi:hypothetical protein